jgi:hypothetical protein
VRDAIAVREQAEAERDRLQWELDTARGDDPEEAQREAEFLAADCLAGDEAARLKMGGVLRSIIEKAVFQNGEVHVFSSRGKATVVLRDDSAAARRIREVLGRINAPNPGFVVPEPFRLVRTADELQRLAKSFENCLALPVWGAAKYHVNLVNGSTVFLISDDPPLLAALHRVATGLWQFEQCAGPKNALPPPGVRSALVRHLVAAGLRIVETDAQSALARIEHEATRGRDGEVDLGDADDEEGDDEDEIAA